MGKRSPEQEILDGIADDDGDRSLSSSFSGPLKVIIGVFIMLLIVLMAVPFYGVRDNPAPRDIPTLADVVPPNADATVVAHTQPASTRGYLDSITPDDPLVKHVADRIASQSCPSGAATCQARAIFLFVQGNLRYVSDPVAFEYVKTPAESLVNEGGDCDDASVLLASLLEAVGLRTRLVFIPRHVYVQVYLPDAPSRYRDDLGWVNLDATCSGCDFGEVPYATVSARKEIVSNRA